MTEPLYLIVPDEIYSDPEMLAMVRKLHPGVTILNNQMHEEGHDLI